MFGSPLQNIHSATARNSMETNCIDFYLHTPNSNMHNNIF